MTKMMLRRWQIQVIKVVLWEVKVLKTWRKFTAEIADFTPDEEGRYDDDFKEEVEARLRRLRRMKIYQHEMGKPITEEEVF